jgi:hypothetical protein
VRQLVILFGIAQVSITVLEFTDGSIESGSRKVTGTLISQWVGLREDAGTAISEKAQSTVNGAHRPLS